MHQHPVVGAGHRMAANRGVDLGAGQPFTHLIDLQRYDFDLRLRCLAVQARQNQR